MHQPPTLFPLFDPDTEILHDGADVPACQFCRNALNEGSECKAHYQALAKKSEGFYQCPFGFTSRSFRFLGKLWVLTGVVAHPRYGTREERELAKRYPEVRVSRAAIDALIKFFRQLENSQLEAVQQSARILPQAFHELRKLNGAVIHLTEREINRQGENGSLRSIKSAAELMRNNFDILEALSNIEGMRAIPSDSYVNLYDLAYKVKMVYQERASSKNLYVNFHGIRPIIRGSQKSFPIVPAVLMENAIKYSPNGSQITVEVSAESGKAVLMVQNVSTSYIDPLTCFDRGTRFNTSVEGGGFGLFLAREIVRFHGGTIVCEVDGTRVRMIVRLPLDKIIS
jgi:signal transduction histidine kinase